MLRNSIFNGKKKNPQKTGLIVDNMNNFNGQTFSVPNIWNSVTVKNNLSFATCVWNLRNKVVTVENDLSFITRITHKYHMSTKKYGNTLCEDKKKQKWLDYTCNYSGKPWQYREKYKIKDFFYFFFTNKHGSINEMFF